MEPLSKYLIKSYTIASPTNWNVVMLLFLLWIVHTWNSLREFRYVLLAIVDPTCAILFHCTFYCELSQNCRFKTIHLSLQIEIEQRNLGHHFASTISLQGKLVIKVKQTNGIEPGNKKCGNNNKLLVLDKVF